LSGRGLCDELITRPEESYRLCCVAVCDLETSRMGAPYIYDISRLRVNLERMGLFTIIVQVPPNTECERVVSLLLISQNTVYISPRSVQLAVLTLQI